MVSIRSRFTRKKLKFAALFSVINMFFQILGYYLSETERISEKSIQTFGSKISSDLSLGEILKSSGLTFGLVLFTLFLAFSLLSITFCLWDIYRSEPNLGWRRIFISIEVITPIYFFLFLGPADDPTNVYSLTRWFEGNCVEPILLGAAAGTILVTFGIWIRSGFMRPPN